MLSAGWWFQTFLIFPNSWDDDPIWQTHIFQGGGEKPPTRSGSLTGPDPMSHQFRIWGWCFVAQRCLWCWAWAASPIPSAFPTPFAPRHRLGPKRKDKTGGARRSSWCKKCRDSFNNCCSSIYIYIHNNNDYMNNIDTHTYIIYIYTHIIYTYYIPILYTQYNYTVYS